MENTRYLYHNFPRPHDSEQPESIFRRGLAILQSIKRSGFIMAPEIVEWRTPVSIGSPSPIRILQQRVCFTELPRSELQDHSKHFGPFAIEFDHMALRRIGALPVIYIPQAMSERDHLALLGPFIVSHLGHIQHMLEQLNELQQFKNPDYIRENIPGAEKIATDCVLTLRNADESRGVVQEFLVPWKAISDLLSYIGFENAPFNAMIGATSIAQSLFYPTDDEHIDEHLGYYRQREWRITAGYSVNGVSRGRSLDDEEKRRLLKINGPFWNRSLKGIEEKCTRLDKAAALAQPGPDELIQMMNRLVVPKQMISEAKQLFNEVDIDAF